MDEVQEQGVEINSSDDSLPIEDLYVHDEMIENKNNINLLGNDLK
jgi:hypothetical protein